MKRIAFPLRGYIIVGLICFVVGLLIILQEKSVFGFVAQLFPGTQSELIFGAITASIGQTIIVYGVVKSNSNKLMTNLQSERQLTVNDFSNNLEQLSVRMQNERQILMLNYNETMSKLDHFIKLNSTSQAVLPVNCKYCGAKIEQNRFCPSCGKAN